MAISDPIRNFERFVQARQRRGQTAVEIRDAIMEHGYDLPSAADAVETFWNEKLAKEMSESS